MRCPGCQHEIPAGSNFCLGCGADLPAGARFCNKCGAPHALCLAGDVASTGGAEDVEGYYREALA